MAGRRFRIHRRLNGRPIDYLGGSPVSWRTPLILYCADNGASGEGSPNGSVNEPVLNGYPTTSSRIWR